MLIAAILTHTGRQWAVFWAVCFIALLIIELLTLGLTTIWFAAGSLAAMLASCAGAGPVPQWLIMLGVAFALLLLIRPVAKDKFNRSRSPTNVGLLVGEDAVVLETIDNVAGTGRVVVNGMEWAAKSVTGAAIAPGEVVTIRAVKGVSLCVIAADIEKEKGRRM